MSETPVAYDSKPEVERMLRDIINRYSVGCIGDNLVHIFEDFETTAHEDGEPIRAAWERLGEIAYELMNEADHYGV